MRYPYVAFTYPPAVFQAWLGLVCPRSWCIVSAVRGPKRKPAFRGYVQKAVNAGKRPFLTATVSGETFAAIDRLATLQNVSRGRVIDRLIEAFELQTLTEGPLEPESPAESIVNAA